MDINFLYEVDNQWVYSRDDQSPLLIRSQELLLWDLNKFDIWIFDSNNWSMYTYSRIKLIRLRVALAENFANESSSPVKQERLIIDFVKNAWTITRTIKARHCDAFKDLVQAYKVCKSKNSKQVNKLLVPVKI